MKVGGTRRQDAARSAVVGERKRSVELRHSEFFEALRAAEAQHATQEEVRALFEPVEAAAQALKRAPTLENLAAYKQAMKEFLSRILQQAYLVDHVRTFRRGRPSVSVLVRTIDAQLDELARLVLAQTRDALAIAAKIDEIRGIILDYFR